MIDSLARLACLMARAHDWLARDLHAESEILLNLSIQRAFEQAVIGLLEVGLARSQDQDLHKLRRWARNLKQKLDSDHVLHAQEGLVKGLKVS